MMEIVIYGIGAGKNGQHTTMFKNCTNLKFQTHTTMLRFEGDNETMTFDYVSESTGKAKEIKIFINQIQGFAVEKTEK